MQIKEHSTVAALLRAQGWCACDTSHMSFDRRIYVPWEADAIARQPSTKILAVVIFAPVDRCPPMPETAMLESVLGGFRLGM